MRKLFGESRSDNDEADDVIDYYDMSLTTDPRRYLKPAIVAAEVLITISVIVCMFLAYHFILVPAQSRQAQASALGDLRSDWSGNMPDVPTDPTDAMPGDALGIVSAPDMSSDEYAFFKGTDRGTLAKGPGLYDGSDPLGNFGNAALAAHRDGWNAPFSDVDKLKQCSDITIETRDKVLTYKVLSSSDDAKERRKQNADCVGDKAAAALDSDSYRDVKGQEVVDPNSHGVTWSVPMVSDEPNDATVSLITFTTCHPHMSNAQRYIVHAVLYEDKDK